MKDLLRVLRGTGELYMEKKIPRSAAALSYSLTMSIFPLIICLYALLGNSYEKMIQALSFVEQFFSADTSKSIRSFLGYVGRDRSMAMTIAGAMLLLTSASAAVRSLQTTIGELQGGRRYRGVWDFLFSIVFSIAFLAAMYFAILVMLTGKAFLEFVDSTLPFLDISSSWEQIRFLLLGGIEFVILWAVYRVSVVRGRTYRTFPGAIAATIGIVVMSWVFSTFIAASARYPLVYGSLASLILLMFWLFLCCQIIYLGAALNVAIRDLGSQKSGEPESGSVGPKEDTR
ncbi:MAG: YihY/virulence factor BrkB family protein [Oscillospiraceae bacterium]|nr:YihY/virulence factor BrkB family protein [Oscillospiraceae bacterium]